MLRQHILLDSSLVPDFPVSKLGIAKGFFFMSGLVADFQMDRFVDLLCQQLLF